MRWIIVLPFSILLSMASPPLFTDVTSTHIPQISFIHSMDAEFGDMNNDSALDIVIAVEGGVNRLYLNDGRGHFTWKRDVFTIVRDTEDLAIADFNRDGNLDVLFVTEEETLPEYYLGDGKGGFQNVSQSIPGCTANAIEAADISGDGYCDVIIGCNGRELVLINDKLGGFLDESAQRLPGNLTESTQDVKLGDLDNDGDLDLVLANENQKNRLLLNNGAGVFLDASSNLPIPYPEETREALLFDVDNDKDLDVVFCNITSNAGSWDKNPQARLLLNNGKAVFTDITATHMPKNTFSSWDGGYLDFDADGDTDLILAAIEVPGFLPLPFRAYRNNGKGIFTDATSEIFPAGVAGFGWDVEVADLNKDGALDLFLAGRASQNRLLFGTVVKPVSLKKKKNRATNSYLDAKWQRNERVSSPYQPEYYFGFDYFLLNGIKRGIHETAIHP